MFTQSEIKKALEYVRQDIRDDFWPDILNYEDFLSSDIFFKFEFDIYYPSPILQMDIPKINLVLRPGHYIKLSDRIYYQLVLNRFAKELDKKLVKKDVSYGYRIAQDDKYFFDNNIRAWVHGFMKRSEENFTSNPGGILIKTDINAFFEHIKIGSLIKKLNQCGVDRESSFKLSELLYGWNENEIGIPQGNNCSSFLANVYLNDVDLAMLDTGYIYYRFVDDIRLFCGSENEARQAIKKLTELLRPLNLHINGGKTEMLSSDKFSIQNNEFAEKTMLLEYSINAYTEEGKDEIEENLEVLWKEAISSSSINKRKFNYCVNRFIIIKSDFPINDILENNLYDPAFSKEVSGLLSIFIDRKDVQNKIIEVINYSCYEYQMIFLLRSLIGAKEIFVNLNDIDKNKIIGSNNFMLIGYYFVAVGKFGSLAQRLNLKNLFENNYIDNDKIARYFLVALINFPNAKELINNLVRKVPALKVTRDYLLSNKQPI